ncbi:MAG TPA: AmmeMemoRadiSam system protein B [Ilumatobacteraceae bacterium]|nr:AmmeMemoRadiSam system protein B [Ilumatobacteraceae bacterium]
MIRIRPPAVAGTFYPGDADLLADSVDRLLAAAPHERDEVPPIALIAPHAGYVYSGPVAASAYVRLLPWRRSITRVVVIGPAHRTRVHGLALSSADAFETPLGTVPTDLVANGLLRRCSGVTVDDQAHAAEHSIEVHLPFLQRVLGDGWSLVPIVAGTADAAMVADALDTVWGADGTLVVISTDLSHYHDARTAHRLDMLTAAEIVGTRGEHLDGEHACGVVPVRGALELVRRHGERVSLLDLRNSGDTAGPASRVVGYGSFLVAAS